jgi:hypothetical protein
MVGMHNVWVVSYLIINFAMLKEKSDLLTIYQVAL